LGGRAARLGRGVAPGLCARAPARAGSSPDRAPWLGLPREPRRGELDLERFEGLVARAERALAAGEADDAATDVEAALAIWRGPALADLADEPLGAAEAGPLDDSRLRALEIRNEARLALGDHSALVAELERLISDEPYRERLHEQYVLALYRADRQKEALEAYHAARRMLSEELGVEPGGRLRELERAILRHDPSLAAPERRRPAPGLLPTPTTSLIGRRLEVAAVTSLLKGGEVRLLTLTGPGGTGKTRLAIAAAEELSQQLRDGAVFVDLAPIDDPGLLYAASANARKPSHVPLACLINRKRPLGVIPEHWPRRPYTAPGRGCLRVSVYRAASG
jgi:tetratricopeptide (TPR) repeat protein